MKFALDPSTDNKWLVTRICNDGHEVFIGCGDTLEEALRMVAEWKAKPNSLPLRVIIDTEKHI